MSQSKSPSRQTTGLWAVSAVLALSALGVYWQRSDNARHEARQQGQGRLAQQMQKRQFATILLQKAFYATNSSTYSALCQTEALAGRKIVRSHARVVHVPSGMLVRYVDGPMRGIETGYNGQLMWRSNVPSNHREAYAEFSALPWKIARQRFELAARNYDTFWLGREEVAGRQAEVIDLRPRQPVPGAVGPTKRLWIDPESGLTLRVMTFNHRMKPVMKMTMQQVDLKPRAANTELVTPEQIREFSRKQPWVAQDMGRDWERDGQKVAQSVGIYPPRPKEIPQGFELCEVGVHRCNYGPNSCQGALTRYTDGLNSLTVFAINPQPQAGGGQVAHYGNGAMIVKNVPQGRIIVVSDMPDEVLQRVADSTPFQRLGDLR